MNRDVAIQARQAGKTYLMTRLREDYLEAGHTVIVCSPQGTSKHRRIKRGGRSIDLIENLSVD